MQTNRIYEVTFTNGHTLKCYSLSDARAMIKNNMYNEKVTEILSTYFDKNSNEKKNRIKL